MTIIKGIEFIVLTYVVFALGWGVQYILWLVPFAYLAGERRKAEIFSLLAIPIYCLLITGIRLPPLPGFYRGFMLPFG